MAPADGRINKGWTNEDWNLNDMDRCEKQSGETNFLPSRGIDGDTDVKTYFTPLGGKQGPKADHDETRMGKIDPPPAGT
jgi:hypothetical protein